MIIDANKAPIYCYSISPEQVFTKLRTFKSSELEPCVIMEQQPTVLLILFWHVAWKLETMIHHSDALL